MASVRVKIPHPPYTTHSALYLYSPYPIPPCPHTIPPPPLLAPDAASGPPHAVHMSICALLDIYP